MNFFELHKILFRFFKRFGLAFKSNDLLRIYTGLLALAILANPWFINSILTGLGFKVLPDWYLGVEVAVVVLLAGICIYLSFRYQSHLPTSVTSRTSIKGLLAFDVDDHRIFSQLQREREIALVISLFSSADHQFALLHGRSGTGKTSFLRAGLLPALREKWPSVIAIYVNFTHQPPVQLIQRALKVQYGMDVDRFTGFLQIVQFLDLQGKSAIFLFDQFEQYLLAQNATKENTEFASDLVRWYQRKEQNQTKILFSIRGDFLDFWTPLRQQMGLNLGPQEEIRLEAFTPSQATLILEVIAQTERIGFDKEFIETVCTEQLRGKENGRISPVDIQILAFMILISADREEVGFNKQTFESIGGVEGLMFRYIEKVINQEQTQWKKEEALKVLLGLVNLDENVKVGQLTLDQLHHRLKEHLPKEQLQTILEYLSRNDVRLVAKVVQEGCSLYELAHERMIASLRRLANKEITDAEKANLLLNQRVNEWLGNHRSSRYLLTWRERRLLHANWPFLQWEPLQQEKQDLLKRSRKRSQRPIIVVIITGILITAGYFLMQTTNAKVWRMERDFAFLAKGNTVDENFGMIALTYYTQGKWEATNQAINKIPDSVTQLKITADCLRYSLLKLKAGDTAQQIEGLHRVVMNLQGRKEFDCYALLPVAQLAVARKNKVLIRSCALYAQAAVRDTIGHQPSAKLNLVQPIIQLAMVLKDEETLTVLNQFIHRVRRDTLKLSERYRPYFFSSLAEAAGLLQDEDLLHSVIYSNAVNARELSYVRSRAIAGILANGDTLFLQRVLQADSNLLSNLNPKLLAELAVAFKSKQLLHKAFARLENPGSEEMQFEIEEIIESAAVLNDRDLLRKIATVKSESLGWIEKVSRQGINASYQLKDTGLFELFWSKVRLSPSYSYSRFFIGSFEPLFFFKGRSYAKKVVLENEPPDQFDKDEFWADIIMALNKFPDDELLDRGFTNYLQLRGFKNGYEISALIAAILAAVDEQKKWNQISRYKDLPHNQQIVFMKWLVFHGMLKKAENMLDNIEREIPSILGDRNVIYFNMVLAYSLLQKWDKVFKYYRLLNADSYRAKALCTFQICREFLKSPKIGDEERTQFVYLLSAIGLPNTEERFRDF
ncbi:MAG TPA: hypothetical protein VMR70_01085 [Flavisolibacter sp.]|nr:hypothetical protein [Flavisolibacter sp.]